MVAHNSHIWEKQNILPYCKQICLTLVSETIDIIFDKNLDVFKQRILNTPRGFVFRIK